MLLVAEVRDERLGQPVDGPREVGEPAGIAGIGDAGVPSLEQAVDRDVLLGQPVQHRRQVGVEPAQPRTGR